MMKYFVHVYRLLIFEIWIGNHRGIVAGTIDIIDCPLPPSYIISVTDNEGEYMIAVVCKDHREQMEKWLVRKIPQGKAKFQEIHQIVFIITLITPLAQTNLVQLSNQFITSLDVNARYGK
jgi:hypothetical protein